jgi:hypothetical protein
MCKPTCCSNDSGSGLGLAVAVLIGIAVIAAIARPVIHAAEVLLEILLITVSALAGLAILITVTIVVIRLRRTRHTAAVPLARTHLRQTAESSALAWQAQEIEPGIWSYGAPQRHELTGIQPGHGKSAPLHRQINAALDAGYEVIIIDGTTGRTWS